MISQSPPTLTFPENVSEFVKKTYDDCETILEFGSGGSTILAGRKERRKIFSVESSKDWADYMENQIAQMNLPGEIKIHYVDIGRTKEWGFPARRKNISQWPNYSLSVWNRSDFIDPDVILIDGRFRKGCFLTSLSKIHKETTILWDDYTDRPQYHFIEEIIQPIRAVGRMAVFECAPGLISEKHKDFINDALYDPA